MEKWFVIRKGADFAAIARRFGIHPVTARLIRNREVVGDAAIEKYLNGGLGDLYDPHLLKDGDKLAEILTQKIKNGDSIRIIGDYDIDGVMASYILYRGIRRCGGRVGVQIPERMRDGYGLNSRLIAEADADGVDTIVTCDNGIAALAEIAQAKALGMTVLVTDHHEMPYEERDGRRRYLKTEADAVVNPKQPECGYPYDGLCGAAVALKVIQLLYEKNGIPAEEAYLFLENAAFATIGDVMELNDENRILVREGLKQIHATKNPGMRALIRKNGLEPEQVDSYHIGFVLGPCINAGGRLETAKISLNLFLQEDDISAGKIAEELIELNIQRKSMTREGVERAKEVIAEGNAGEKVLVVYLKDVHESLAGIIAGRIREAFARPTFILTRGEEGIKGSGRSVEGYPMYDELCKCRELFTRFGGHPMAAGISLSGEDVDIFRKKINACCELTDEDFIPKIKIDVAMPADYPDVRLVREFSLLAPFGKGNSGPRFADKGLRVRRAHVVGRNQNVLRLELATEQGGSVSAVYFGDIDAWKEYYAAKYGTQEIEKAFRGQENGIRMSVVYDPEINDYRGTEYVQLVIRNYQ